MKTSETINMKKRWILSLVVGLSLISLVSAWGDQGAEKLVAELEWRGLFTSTVHQLIISSISEVYAFIPEMIASNPAIGHSLIWDPLTYFIKILEPLYVLTIILVGFYLILMSGSPSGRVRAKSLLPRLIVSMVLVTLSPYILRISLGASESLTRGVLNMNPPGENIFLETFESMAGIFANKALISMEGSHFFLLIALIISLGIFILLALRYVMLILFIILLPISIFLYFINPTRSVGRAMIEQNIIWMITQVFCALVFVSSNIGMPLLNLGGDLEILAGLTASIIFIISPIIPILIIRKILP